MKKVLKTIGNFFYKTRYFWQKVGISLITLCLTTILVFCVLLMTPGDVVETYALNLMSNLSCDYNYAYSLAVKTLGYDPNAPWYEQFAIFLRSLFEGNLGNSIYNSGVTGILLIKEKLPWTLFISSIALIISFILGTTFGSIMAQKRETVSESIGNAYIMISTAIPDYLIGFLLLIVFSYTLHIFPSESHYDPELVDVGFNLPFIFDALKHAFLPIMTYVISGTSGWMMLMRSNSVSVLGENYILAAKARGIPERRIASKYVKRNSMLPIITSLAISFAALFGGSSLIESVFNYPGIGLEFAQRVGNRDYFIMAGLLFFSSTIVIIANLITDCLYSVIDPRVRRQS